jgi:hypothetical protein
MRHKAGVKMKVETKKEGLNRITDIKTVIFSARVGTEVSFEYMDQNGYNLYQNEGGELPKFFPTFAGEAPKGFIDFEIDIETGQILNWVKPSQQELEEAITPKIKEKS